MVEEGASQAEMGDSLLAQYDGDPAEIRSVLDQLIAQPQAEELISVLTGAADSVASADVRATANGAGEGVAFQTPDIEKFSDMADLLLLGPIHDVDEVSWPIRFPRLSNDAAGNSTWPSAIYIRAKIVGGASNAFANVQYE